MKPCTRDLGRRFRSRQRNCMSIAFLTFTSCQDFPKWLFERYSRIAFDRLTAGGFFQAHILFPPKQFWQSEHIASTQPSALSVELSSLEASMSASSCPETGPWDCRAWIRRAKFKMTCDCRPVGFVSVGGACEYHFPASVTLTISSFFQWCQILHVFNNTFLHWLCQGLFWRLLWFWFCRGPSQRLNRVYFVSLF